jgi:hypothetical protein
MVDALVALTILAMTLGLSLVAADRAIRAARLANEIRQADALLRDILISGPRSLRPLSGATADYAWTVETQVTGADRPIEVCRRYVQLTSLRSTRHYWASTSETCPAEDPA